MNFELNLNQTHRWFEKQQGGQVRVRVRVQGSMNSNWTEPNLGTLVRGKYYCWKFHDTVHSLHICKYSSSNDLDNMFFVYIACSKSFTIFFILMLLIMKNLYHIHTTINYNGSWRMP